MYQLFQVCSINVHSSLFGVVHNVKQLSFRYAHSNKKTLTVPNKRKLFNRVKAFFADERGLNTVELVVIIAIVIGLALLFRSRITDYVTTLLDAIFSENISKDLVSDLKVK